jgi:gamma-glutamyltranspeptidase/glutathione hydrolase
MASSRRDFLAGLASTGLLASCGGPRPIASRPTPARGMVASSQRHASEAGAAILRAGGNAADAAVTMAAALAVTEPTSTGIGGDCFALYYDATARRVTGLNGSGRSPAALTLERLEAEGLRELGPSHGHTITVPGACAGWCDLAARHGTRPLAELFAPAIALAEDGFAVARVTAHFWDRAAERLRAARGGSELLVGDAAPRAGETFRNPGMARTLRAVAAGGAEAFYRGDIARAIVEAVSAAGGAMTEADLAAHESSWDDPISVRYRDLDVWQCPPNGQGLTALLALNLLSSFELAGQDPLGSERWHLLVEAMRIAFADTRWYLADPSAVDVPVRELLSPSYARERARLVDPRATVVDPQRGSPVGHSETVYFCTADAAGNACSFINSNYMGVGTGVVPLGWGFPLHDRGLCFSFERGHPNALAPRKRPYHTIMPGLLTRPDGSLYGPFGVMGGFMQPQGHVQVVVGLVDDGLSPQAVLDRPRFCVEPVDGETSRVYLEEGLPAATAARLSELGHPITEGVSGFDRARFGRGQIVRVANGALEGGSDGRADGCALQA